jgi:hypothetical protein
MILASRILGFVPRLRRRFRPKLRRRGIRGGPRPRLQRPIRPRPAMNEPQAAQSTLLIRPPDSGHNGDSPVQGPIPVDFSGPLVTRSSLAAWLKSRTVQRLVGGLVTIAIFIWILRPIVLRWHMVGNRILATSPLRFILAAVMFATFLFVIRVISWRLIISGFGTCLPRGAAARIWSTSELARYVPGVIWQVVGRVYLVRPYGVDAITCSTSQILELTIFLVANILLALVCLPAFAGSTLFAGASPQDQAYARDALITTAVLSPLLLLLLKPSIFYGVVNGVLRLIGKRPIATRIGGKTLLVLMLLALTGLIWQGLAIWVLIGQPKALNIPIDRIGLIIGAYSLAWSFGFLAFWAPGGLGVRELILVTTLRYALPDSVAKSLGDADSVKAFLAFVAVLLRLWTIAGEFILTSIAYAIDHRGALGRPDAPGRIENARTAAYPPKDGAPN